MIGITKSEFESSLFREKIVEYYLSMSKDQIHEKFGSIISDMVGYNQNNPHHCYDLFEHTLHTVKDVPTGELSNDEIKLLKIAAFLHDVAKPVVATEMFGKNTYFGNAVESAKRAQLFLEELGYSDEDVAKIYFYISHLEDYLYFKDELPYYYDHNAYIKKISALTIAEQMIENEYDLMALGYDSLQIKAICYALVRNEEWPLFENEKGDEVKVAAVDINDLRYRLSDIRMEFTPTLKDYRMLSKLCIANYKAQAKKSYQKGKLIATSSEKVRVSAIIEAVLPEAYRIFEETVEKYEIDGTLTQELLDAKNEFEELSAINQIEHMREENAKNLKNKFNDARIRLRLNL